MSEARRRRLGGWGFEGESCPPSPEMLSWLRSRLGEAAHGLPGPGRIPDAAPAALPRLPAEVSDEPGDRMSHARGQGLPDIIRLRSGRVPALPDGVCRPASADEVESVLAACATAGVTVIPWGGGTSVTGGVNVLPGDSPVLSLDLERLSGLLRLDATSGLAAVGPGTTGPRVEAALGEHGLTLGHFPQSWELSTVGGWVATRSAGQESLGYGRIEDMVAGLELVAPAGRMRLPALPASAAGPDLRHLAMGSEGRLGVITEVTLRVRERPAATIVEGAVLPDLSSGIAAARELVRDGVPLTLLRLSDPAETEVAMSLGLAASRLGSLARSYLRMRGIGAGASLMLYGSAGEPELACDVIGCARSVLRRHHAVGLGRGPGRHWLRDRYRHPYLREELLALGIATDTLETAVPWSAVATTRERVAAAISIGLAAEGQRVAVLCHISHPYRDGASLYFTLFFLCAADPDHTIARWATLKRAACTALVACGATISHHHGVGQWHAPWLEPEISPQGRLLLEAAVRHMDPSGILNPHVLLDPQDRLEA